MDKAFLYVNYKVQLQLSCLS